MARTIFALGGGTFGEHRNTYKSWSLPMPPGQEHYEVSTTPIDKLILKATGKKKPTLLLITTASEDGHHDLKLLEQGFRTQFEERLGASFDTLYLLRDRPSIPEIKHKIEKADAIYVSGGNTYRLMRVWRRLGVHILLRQAYVRGTVMSGMSAGSICWFKYGNSNSFYDNKPFRLSGMNWLNLLICPHFDTEPYRQPALKSMMKRTPGTIGLALDEHAAIEIVDDMYRLHYFKKGAKAQKCYWTNNEYVVEELSAKNNFKLLQDLIY